MSGTLTSEQISRAFTAFSPDTVRSFAKRGKVPVDHWDNGEPIFRRDPQTIGALVGLSREGSVPRGQ